MKKIIIVDYNLGNLFSLQRALHHVGCESLVSSNAADIKNATHLLLPGVGAFGDGIKNLRERALTEPVKQFAATGKPLLGICLGMQLLMTVSEEFGTHEGLNLIDGRVVRFQDASPDGPTYKIPNIGWRALEKAKKEIQWDHTILDGIKPGNCVYFVHSYKVVPNNKENSLAMTNYAQGNYCSVITKDNIHGCQFHPEKSGEVGLQILKNFLNQNAWSEAIHGNKSRSVITR